MKRRGGAEERKRRISKYGEGGKRTGGRKRAPDKRVGWETEGRGCLMPRIITAFNLERPRVLLFLPDDIRATSKVVKGQRRFTRRR